jgi:hypothetical protein
MYCYIILFSFYGAFSVTSVGNRVASGRGPVLRYIPAFAWRDRKTTKLSIRIASSRGPDLNPRPPEYEAVVTFGCERGNELSRSTNNVKCLYYPSDYQLLKQDVCVSWNGVVESVLGEERVAHQVSRATDKRTDGKSSVPFMKSLHTRPSNAPHADGLSVLSACTCRGLITFTGKAGWRLSGNPFKLMRST